jgi:Flp pilus assembly protein TadD
MSETVSTAADKARTLIGLKRPDEAVRVATTALATEPESPELLRLLAHAHIAARRHQDAHAAASAAIRLDPDHEWGHRLLSVAAGGTGDHQLAVRSAAEAQRLAPNSWRTHSQQAIASAQAGYSCDAVRAGRQAVQLGPDQPDTHFALGYAYAADKQPAEAEAAYRRTLALQPDHATALNNLGNLQLKKPGGLRRANQQYAAALTSDAQLAVARRNLKVIAGRYARRFHLAVFIACIILRTAFDQHSTNIPGVATTNQVTASSRIAAAAVGGLSLAILFAAIVIVDRRLPRNLRYYYHRLPITDRILGMWLGVDVAALVVVCLIAVPTTYSGRALLVTVATCLLLAGVVLSWLPRLTKRLQQKQSARPAT